MRNRVECAIHERLRIVTQPLAEAADRRLRAELSDPCTRAVVTLAMVIQHSSLNLWCGRFHPREKHREMVMPPENPGTPEISERCPQVPLVGAVCTTVETISEVVSPPHPSRN